MGNYTWTEWISFFYIYAFLGWIWETCYVSIKKGKWVNRGFLRGPMLPIYGSGAVIMLAVSMPFVENYVLTFFAGIFGATLLEYVTGWVMERLFKVRYWDYTNQPFNLHGYICLTSSIAWGFFTIMMTNILHPPVEQITRGLFALDPYKIILILVTVVFVIDSIVSVKAALDVANALEKIGKIRTELENIQVQVALLKMETADYVEEKLEKIKETSESIEARNIARLKELTLRREELAQSKERIFEKINFTQKGLLHGNPGATAGKLEKSFRELREKMIKL